MKEVTNATKSNLNCIEKLDGYKMVRKEKKVKK
jgi:hypothetical protein